MKKRDIILILAILLFSLTGGAFMIPTGVGGTVDVYKGNTLFGSYDLNDDRIITVEADNGIINTIEISGERVRMKDATCQNRICVECGWIAGKGESICCAPAGVLVMIRGEGGDYDAITK